MVVCVRMHLPDMVKLCFTRKIVHCLYLAQLLGRGHGSVSLSLDSEDSRIDVVRKRSNDHPYL